MSKILLVHPLFLSKSPDEQELSSPYFPLGLLYLAGYVREHGHDVAVFDGTFAPDESTFADALEREQPDMVGISALAPTRDQAVTLAAMAGAAGPIVVVGGPDPTARPEVYLAEAAIDIVVHHEGEQTISRLLDLVAGSGISPSALAAEPGVAFRRDGVAVVNEPRPPIENLDELPLPARDLIDMDRYLETWQDRHGYSSLTISTTRGCPFGCSWCRDSVHGTGFRQRSPESVAAEVQALARSYDIDRLRVVDDIEGIDRHWFERWADATEATGTAIPFEPLNDVGDRDLPLLDVRDSL